MLEKLVQAEEIPVTAPDECLLLRRQLVPGLMYREIEFVRTEDKSFLPQFHCLASPAGDGIIIYRQIFIGYDKVLIYADDLAISFADRTCTERRVEAEEMLRGLLEDDAVLFKLVREPDGLRRLLIGDGECYMSSACLLYTSDAADE